MKRGNIREDLRVVCEKKLYTNVFYQALLVYKRIFVERYLLSDTKPSVEILIFVGLNILPSTKYFGRFPFNLCKEINANVSIVYEVGCSGVLNRHFRRFTQEEAEEQYLAGLEVVKDYRGKIIIFSHSASTMEHLKLIFNDKYKHFCEDINIAGGIVSAAVTNILVELKKVWPNYKQFNWRGIMQIARHFDLPLPVYPYYSKSRHAAYSSMNNLSIWINSKTAEFLFDTDIKKVILNGKRPDYPLLIFIPKHDSLFSPARQGTLARYMSKKAKITLVKCDAEHNIFLSIDSYHILEAVKEYVKQCV